MVIALLFICFLATPYDRALGQSTKDRPVLLIDIKGAIGFVAAGQLAKALEQAAAHGVSCRDRPARHAGRAVDVHARDDSHDPGLAHSHHHVRRAKRQQSGQRRHLSHVRGARGRHGAWYASGGRHADLPFSVRSSGLAAAIKTLSGLRQEVRAGPIDCPGRKSINDAVAYIRSLAELRGRNADWGEKAVREAATLTASAALKERVIDVIAKDIDELLSQIDGRSVTTAAGEVRLETKGRSVVELKPDWKMQLMSAITDPNIALILLMIGIYGILFEFWSPGAIAPGVIGGICLIVALTALAVLPVNYAGLALLLFGVALMVAEAFTPGFGIAGPRRHCSLRHWRAVPVRPGAVGYSDRRLLAGGGRHGGSQRRILCRCDGFCRTGAPSPGADRRRADDRQHGRGRELDGNRRPRPR